MCQSYLHRPRSLTSIVPLRTPLQPPKEKKSKKEKLAEKKAKAAAAAAAAAEEEEERQRLAEIARKQREAEDAVLAAEETERVAAADAVLASQAQAQEGFEFAKAEELAIRRMQNQEAYEWQRFSSCCARPDPREQRQVAGYESAIDEVVSPSLSDALDTAENHELIVREAELYRDWALGEGKTADADNLVKCRRHVRALTETSMDRATAHLLHTAEKHQNEDGDILVHRVRDDFKYALWMNHVKNPRFKAITVPEFDDLSLELPKELSMATIAMRAFHRTYCEFESFEEVEEAEGKMPAAETPEETAEPETAPDDVPHDETGEAANDENEKENMEQNAQPEKETESAEVKHEPETIEGETKTKATEETEGETPVEETVVEPEPVETEPVVEPEIRERKPLGSVESIGGILTLDLLTLPPLPEVANDWTMRAVTPLTNNVKRVPYPIPATGAEPKSFDAIDLDAPPVTVSYRLSSDLVLSDPEPRVGWWDETQSKWRTDGVSDVRVENGVLMYSTVKLGHLSLLQSRHEYLPYREWSIRPSASGEECVVAVVPGNEHFAGQGVEIEVGDGWCALLSVPVPELETLLGTKMRARELLQRLAERGVRLTPDERNCASVVKAPKEQTLELKFCKVIATLAPSFAVAMCKFNGGVGPSDALVRVVEVHDFDLVSGEDVFKIFQRERDGVVLSLLMKTKGVALVDARHKLGALSPEIEAHAADGRDNVGAAAVRARRDGFEPPLVPLTYFATAVTWAENISATELSMSRIKQAPVMFTETLEGLLGLMRVCTFG